MAAPNFQYYYWTANVRVIVHWLYEHPGADAPSWLQLETLSCRPSSLSALTFCNILPTTEYIKNIIVKNTVKIWFQCKYNFNWRSLPLRAPVGSNHLFSPSLSDKTFSVWDDLGIKTFADLYDNGIFMSFSSFQYKFDLPNTDFFRYLQFRNFMSKNFSQFPNAPPQNPIDFILDQPQNFQGYNF